MRHVKKNDQVEVIAGKDKGKKGRVLHVLDDGQRLLVQGINNTKRHLKAGKRKVAEQGGIVEMESPIQVSNVLPWCEKCTKGMRVTIRYVGQGGSHYKTLQEATSSFEGKLPEKMRKIRVCHKCGQAID